MKIELSPHSIGCLLLISFALILAGCGRVDVITDFYRGENWEAVIDVSFSLQALSMLGGSPAEIESQLDEMVIDAKSEGVRASWEKTQTKDAMVYTVKMKGQGLDKLSEAAFDGEAEIRAEKDGGQRVIHFSHYVDPGLGFESQTITLRGGEIIDGNGRLVDKRTMIWRDAAGRIEATLTERSRLGVGSILGILAVVVFTTGLAVGGAHWWRRRRTVQPTPCPWCGFWIPEGARFCPGCGRPRE